MIQVSSSLHFVSGVQVAQPSRAASESCWSPNTDVYSVENGLMIRVELAGVQREHLELSAEGSRLKIRGQRPDGCRGPKCKFLAMEIHYGPFEAVIDVPPSYDISLARASYQNGFLSVEIPFAVEVGKKPSGGKSKKQG